VQVIYQSCNSTNLPVLVTGSDFCTNYSVDINIHKWRGSTYLCIHVGGEVPSQPHNILMLRHKATMKWHIVAHHDSWVLWSFS